MVYPLIFSSYYCLLTLTRVHLIENVLVGDLSTVKWMFKKICVYFPAV